VDIERAIYYGISFLPVLIGMNVEFYDPVSEFYNKIRFVGMSWNVTKLTILPPPSTLMDWNFTYKAKTNFFEKRVLNIQKGLGFEHKDKDGTIRRN